MIGPLVNAASTLSGGLAGTLLAHRVTGAVRARLNLVLGLAAAGMGIALCGRLHALAPVILALLAGAMLGEVLRIETALGRLAGALRRLVDRLMPDLHASGLSHAEHSDRLVAALVLFTASGTGIFGAMNAGITGDPSILFVKAALDLVTAAVLAADLGLSIAVIAVPQVLAQLGFFMLGRWIMPLVTPEMLADFSGLGGMVMLATGLRICGLAPFPVANMLPALVLVMPVSALMG